MANQIPLTGSTEAGGGALLPNPLSQTVIQQIQRISGALELSDTQPTSSRKESIPLYKGRPVAQLVEEGDAAPVDGAEFAQASLTAKKISVVLPFTQELLSDAVEDPRIFANSDVIAAIANAADAEIVSGSGFDSNLVGDAGDSVTLASDIDKDGLRKSVSEAMAKLEGNGYTPNGVLLGPDANGIVRDARSSVDDTQAVYDGVSPFYGLRSAISTNLNPVAGTAGDACGVVADWSHCKVRVRQDISLTTSDQAAYSDGGNLVSAWERDVVLLKWTMRIGFLITDSNAVVVINQISD